LPVDIFRTVTNLLKVICQRRQFLAKKDSLLLFSRKLLTLHEDMDNAKINLYLFSFFKENVGYLVETDDNFH